ncbi:hypothetical protein J3Q64DRAFT_1824060 [Phycomyces blakesleeanus]|uniref:Uncharacterized protein n=1 Tax=Phycomyces blakesleeanus TaxID=4837 RepID=A0ABR3ARH9_PHYBL
MLARVSVYGLATAKVTRRVLKGRSGCIVSTPSLLASVDILSLMEACLLCLFLSLLSSTLCSPFFFKFILREEAAANHHACCLKSRIQGFGESPTKLAKLEKSPILIWISLPTFTAKTV